MPELKEPELKELVKLSIDVLDESGHPIAEPIHFYLSENVPRLGAQYRVTTKGGADNLIGKFPAGSYTYQIIATGYAVARGAISLTAGEVRQKITLVKQKEIAQPTFEENLATIYGIKSDQLQSITVQAGQHLVLDYRSYAAKAHFTVLKPQSLDDIKRWVGMPDSAWGHKLPRFGTLPSGSAINSLTDTIKKVELIRASKGVTSEAPDLTAHSNLQSIAREYIHGNTAAVKNAVADPGILKEINQTILGIGVIIPIFFYQNVTIQDGGQITIGKGSSAFLVNTLTIYPKGYLNIVGDVKIYANTWKQI